jgi:hypothetical protein
MPLNLKKDFKSILRRYGHDIYLQRILNPEVGNEEFEYSNKLEKWTVYSVMPGGSIGITHVQDEANEGVVYNADMVFYMQPEVSPISGDRIYEQWDRLPQNQVLYTVDFAYPERGLGGNIVYWIVGCSKVSPN